MWFTFSYGRDLLQSQNKTTRCLFLSSPKNPFHLVCIVINNKNNERGSWFTGYAKLLNKELLPGVSWKKHIKLRSLLTVKRWRKTRKHQYNGIIMAKETYFCRMVFKCYWYLNSGSSGLRKNSSKSQTQTILHSLISFPFFIRETESQCLFNVSPKYLIWKYPKESSIAIVG